VVNKIYSIGYSGLSIQNFVELLRHNGIQVVVDVRSVPYSKHFADYNKDNIQTLLYRYGVHYRNYAKEFGARQEDTSYYSSEGFLDFEKFSLSDSFISGFNKLKASMEKDYTFVLMCSEKDPFECHRSIMVSRNFHTMGYQVNHLLQNGYAITQEEIEKRLLDKYFPNRAQLSLETVSDISTPEETTDFLTQAYRKRNSEIGYRLQEGKR